MASDFEFGAVSSGTMRPEDLIPVFEWELKELDPKSFAHVERKEADVDYEDSEYVNDLMDAIDDAFGAPYGYFDANEGDGACYGYWIAWDALADDIKYGIVLKVKKGTWPDIISENVEYILEEDRYENVTLYDREQRIVWQQ